MKLDPKNLQKLKTAKDKSLSLRKMATATPNTEPITRAKSEL